VDELSLDVSLALWLEDFDADDVDEDDDADDVEDADDELCEGVLLDEGAGAP
jgi:hypothetical protein